MAVIIPLYACDSARSLALLGAATAQVLLSLHRLTVTEVLLGLAVQIPFSCTL